jgi:hypothetical protein
MTPPGSVIPRVTPAATDYGPDHHRTEGSLTVIPPEHTEPVRSVAVCLDQGVGIFPDDAAVLRLAGAVLIEAHDEWQVAERRYLSEGSMAKLAPSGDDAARPKEVRRATAELVAT